MNSLYYGSPSSLEAYLDLRERVKTVEMERLRENLNTPLSSILSALKNPLKAFSPTKISLREDDDEGGEDEQFSPGMTVTEVRDNGVGILHIRGELVDKFSWWHPLFAGSITSYEAISDAANLLANDKKVKSVVLAISSGGGYVSGIEGASNALAALKAQKPVSTHTADAAFSAAYWLGAVGSPFYADRMAQVGSIGVLAVQTSAYEMLKQMGVQQRAIRIGEFKALGQTFEAMDSEAKKLELEKLEQDGKTAYGFFLEHIAQNRKLSVSEKDEWAEGKTFFSEDAVKIGLLDGVMTLEQMVAQRAYLASSNQPRGYQMKISAEKRALLAAGKDAKDVLTDEEFEQYTAELKESSEKTKAKDAKDGLKANDEKDDPEDGGPSDGKSETSLTAEYRALIKSEARLEAKVEDLTEKLKSSSEAFDKLKAENTALQEVALTAVHNLQTALGKQKETPGDATALVETFHALRGEMSSVFSAGQKTSNDVKDKKEDEYRIDPRVRRLAART